MIDFPTHNCFTIPPIVGDSFNDVASTWSCGMGVGECIRVIRQKHDKGGCAPITIIEHCYNGMRDGD